MAYTKQTWVTGETITADKLNHIEDGIASIGGYDIVFSMTEDAITADGASLEELISGGYKKALLSHSEGSAESVGYGIEQDDSTNIGFTFIIGNSINIFSFDDNGKWSLARTGNILEGAYTYSNGHYVFTIEDSGD